MPNLNNSLLNLPTSWNPPPVGFVKINTDASIGNGFISLRMVVRNHIGEVLRVHIEKVICESPEVAEALANLKAMMLVSEERFPKVYCESDLKAIVQNLNNQVSCPVYWSSLGIAERILDFQPRIDSFILFLDPKKL